MKELLQIEWLKIRKYRTFRIIALLFMLLLPLINLGISRGLMSFGTMSTLDFFSKAYSFPEVWGNVAYWAGYLVMILAILMIILVTNEYQFRTHRQNVMDGLRRIDFFQAKAFLVVVISAGATLFYVVISLLFALMSNGISGFGDGGFEKILYFFVYTLNYLGFATLLGFLIRRSGLAISLFILYVFVVENLLSAWFKYALKNPLGSFLPLQSSDEMLPLPLTRFARTMLGQESKPEAFYFMLASLVWVTVYYFVGRKLFLKRDL